MRKKINENSTLLNEILEKHCNISYITDLLFKYSWDEDLILKYIEAFNKHKSSQIIWNHLCIHQKLSEQFIDKYKDKVDWFYIVFCQDISEIFLEKHIDKVSWFSISVHRQLSEYFMEKYKDKLIWYEISEYQFMSVEFMIKNVMLLDYNRLMMNEKVDKRKLDKIDFWTYMKIHNS